MSDEKDAVSVKEIKIDKKLNDLEGKTRKLGKLVRTLLNVLAVKYLGESEVKKIEKQAGVDLDGDGKIGFSRPGILAGLVAVLICAGVAWATMTVDMKYDGNARYGTYKLVSDEAGSITLTVDKVVAAGGVTAPIAGAVAATTLSASGTTDLNGVTTATNITMDTGSTLAAKILTVATTCTITPSATLTGGFDANGVSTATNITMDTGSTLAAKILTVATTCTITPSATLTGGFDANAPSTATNLTFDPGSTITATGATIAGGTLSGSAILNATMTGTNEQSTGMLEIDSAGAVFRVGYSAAEGWLLATTGGGTTLVLQSDYARTGGITRASWTTAGMNMEGGVVTNAGTLYVSGDLVMKSGTSILVEGTSSGLTTNITITTAAGTITNTFGFVDGILTSYSTQP